MRKTTVINKCVCVCVYVVCVNISLTFNLIYKYNIEL